MIKYPNGKTFKKKDINRKLSSIEVSFSSSNRGMDFEEDINISNQYYAEHGIALITKRPTPINVVHVDYSNNAKITEAYFEKESTTDYNGIYKEKYIDFEAKSTLSKSSFPLANISLHQINHLREVLEYGGISFLIINFEKIKETFILKTSDFLDFFKNEKRKSIPLEYFLQKGVKLAHGYRPRLYYLDGVDFLFFNK